MTTQRFETLEITSPAANVVQILLDRPPVNALSRKMVGELTAAARDVAEDPGLRVVLLAAKGKAFCAGADLKERHGMNDEQVLETVRAIGTMVAQVAAIPVPTIAVISGAALGGGLELALGCDLRLASDSAKLGLPECSLAIIPGAGGTQRLARLVGPARAKHWVFSAQIVPASVALEDGVVDRVTPCGGLDAAALELAGQIARCGPVALRAAKGAIDDGLAAGSLAAGIEVERSHYARTIPTQDRREALAAFGEKRKPRFTGR